MMQGNRSSWQHHRNSYISPLIARKSVQLEKALEQRSQSITNIGKIY